MRAVLVPMLFFGLVALVMAAPYTGVLLWTWITMMNPHQMTGGWFATFALNSLVVLVLASAMLLHRERALPPLNSLTVVLILFMLWCMLTTFFALSPYITAARADLSFKSMIFALVVAATTNNRVRLQALIWIFVLSYGFFGVKGGAFTILTAGSGNVIGPARTTIEDRNALALVMLMTIPLSYYLLRTSTSRMLRLLLLGIMVLNAFAIMGTYSRGGVVGLLVLGLYFWLASSHKLTLAACAMAIGLAGWSVLPDRWMERMSTVQEADQDASFQGRVDAWRFAINAAGSRPLGVGFSGTEDALVFSQYLPDAEATFNRGRAAHSIYFQVLGDHGFVGLGLFLAMMACAWRTAGRLARRDPEQEPWLAELGKMIRVALVTYLVVGAALSMAYDLSILCILGLLSAAAKMSATPAGARQRRHHGGPAVRVGARPA